MYHCGDFHLLSEEFFDFYPIIKTYIIYDIIYNKQKFSIFNNIINNTLKFNKLQNFTEQVILKANFFERDDLMQNYPTQMFLQTGLDLEEIFEKDLIRLAPEEFSDKYFKSPVEEGISAAQNIGHNISEYDVLRLVFNKQTSFDDDGLFIRDRRDSKLVKLISIYDWNSYFRFITYFPINQEGFTIDFTARVKQKLDVIRRVYGHYENLLNPIVFILSILFSLILKD